MPYNETFEKLKAAQNPAFAEEIEAVKDNQTFFIGAYESSLEGNIPKGDFNEIFQALLNNDKALKILTEAIQARTITAGNGLQGGGSLAANRTINVVSADDSITVAADNIKVNTYDGVDGASTTRPGSAAAVKKAYDKCPYNVGDIFLTTNSTNPSTVWLGTTWQKIEGRMLKGTSGSGASKQTGGSDTVTLTTANMPAHTHPAETSAHTHTQPAHKHSIYAWYSTNGATYHNRAGGFAYGVDVGASQKTEANACFSAGGDTTGGASPTTSIGSTGSGTAFSVLNAYYTVHMWLRTA